MNKVIHVISGLSDGGAEGVLYRLCKYDVSNRHCVISLTDGGKYGHILLDQGVEVVYLKMKSNIFNFIIGFFKLFFILRKNKSSIVQTWMYHADLIGGSIAKLAGVNDVFWNVRHTTLESGKSKKSVFAIAKACAFISKFVPKKIVYCAYQAKTIHEEMGYIKNKGEVIGNGYDLSLFANDAKLRELTRSNLQINSAETLIGMVGRFDPQKDHFNLIQALGLVKSKGYDFKLLLVGRDLDESNQDLLNNINANNIFEDVILLGTRKNIPAVMNSLDIHVLASSFGEAFPNVLAEAMACGTPCVTTDVGDASVIVSDTGWVVPPKNPQALASAILDAMNEEQNNPKAWQIRKQASRERIVSNFGIDKMVARYHQVWGNV